MKVEVRCPACGKGYLVDERRIPPAGSSVLCQACGARIALPPPARKTRPAATAPRPASAPPAPPASSSSAASPVNAPSAAPAERPGEVCCPRCGLHFVPSAARATEAALERRTVLLVEDMDYFVEIAREALASRYEVKIAKSLDEARAVLLNGRVDLMLLDLTLERGEDGLALLRETPGKVCPVLLFTAQDESEMYGAEWEAMKTAGVDDVVIKGINMGETLLRKVAALLGEPLSADAPLR